ncbi:MAG: DUF1844 domain-containing protein [Desulfurivibrio sp.]|jgi:hypothetical protein|nr:MAG: DUF1844 domain-containing protein [Desulfurivibrio sp.]
MSKADKNCKCAGGKMVNGKCVMPEVTFSAFVMSLNTSALYLLGEIADPETGARKQDLVLAKHTIDTLNVLKEKTKGNLTEEEENMLGKFLYDLQMRYVKAKS